MQTEHKNILQASIFVAISGVLYGFLGLLGTNIVKESISISTMLFWRFFIAGLWILLFTIPNLKSDKISLNYSTLVFMFILGAVGYAGSSGFYFIASQYTGTGLAMVIFFSYPILVALASWLLHKKNPNTTVLLALLFMTVGLILLSDLSLQSVNMKGIFFGISAAACYAFYVIGSKRIASMRAHPNVITTMVCFGCAVIFLFLSLQTHSFVFPQSLKSWISLLALGILATALPIQLMLKGLKYISSMRASIISVLEPLVTVFLGILVLKESVSSMQMLGIVILLSSALLVQFHKEL